MVTLCLTTTRGNGGSRHFPFQGYLGLTPVRVDGIVRTRFDDDRRPILAKSLTVSVRAYEARQTRLGATHTRLLVDYSQTLWKKPEDEQYVKTVEYINNRRYHRALGKVQRLVIQRLFELHRLNLAQTGEQNSNVHLTCNSDVISLPGLQATRRVRTSQRAYKGDARLFGMLLKGTTPRRRR